MTHVLYNPLSDNRCGKENAEKLREVLAGEEMTFVDVCETDAGSFIAECPAEDRIILSGGDGTLNRFVNSVGDIPDERPVYLFPSGSGNDFAHDVGVGENGLILLNPYIRSLPMVKVDGKKLKFVNGIGYGIDGYVCEKGDILREKSAKRVNYTSIAIGGLLGGYKPVDAAVRIDGKEYRFKKVWLAPTMNGRFYGGGMEVTPQQDRLDPERKLSVAVVFGLGKLRTLSLFPTIFEGKHVEHTEAVSIMKGYEIQVKFDRPTALQVDGETFLGVTSYIARSSALLADSGKNRAAQTV